MLQLALSSWLHNHGHKHYTRERSLGLLLRVTSTVAKHHPSLCGTTSSAACKHLASGHGLSIKPFLGTRRKRSGGC